MKLKLFVPLIVGAMLMVRPTSAADEGFISRLQGTFSTDQKTFVTIKRLTFTRDKEGKLKISGSLVGFPDEVSIGEAIADPYSAASSMTTNKPAPDTVLASFSSTRYKPLVIITSQYSDARALHSIAFTCYMLDNDGTKVHLNGILKREE